MESDVVQTVLKSIRERGTKYLGVTVMPGPQLGEAIRLTREVKSAHPHVKTIWGGYFPSLHTNVVLQSGLVDYVIRGEGDLALPALLDSLEASQTSPSNVLNLS